MPGAVRVNPEITNFLCIGTTNNLLTGEVLDLSSSNDVAFKVNIIMQNELNSEAVALLPQ